jgi:hypothetical protein
MGNINSDPIFEVTLNGLLDLGENSPCINAGNQDTTGMALPLFDFAGNLRIISDTVDMGAFEFQPSSVLQLDLKVFLEGPFNVTDMNTTLNSGGFLPLLQPYSTVPWNYNGTESVTAIQNSNVVDWALVELRDAATATQATGLTVLGRKAGWILNDGSIVEPDGVSFLQFSNLTVQNNLFVVVWHRNSIGVMSAGALTETGGVYHYDFTSASGQVYGGSLGHIELAPGIWGMIAADGNADNQINYEDKNDVWSPQSGMSGYKQGDFNLDAQVNNGDKNDVWKPNTWLGGQVPQ